MEVEWGGGEPTQVSALRYPALIRLCAQVSSAQVSSAQVSSAQVSALRYPALDTSPLDTQVSRGGVSYPNGYEFVSIWIRQYVPAGVCAMVHTQGLATFPPQARGNVGLGEI